MATLRTYDEKAAILERCLELEQHGGDILAYLWSQNYISPRATWCNFQREWLNRKPYEFTDGKPGKGTMMKRVRLTDENRAEAVRLAIEGKDPRAYLEGLGVSDPAASWQSIKKYYRETSPDVYEKIPSRIPAGGLKVKPKADKGMPKADVPTVKLDGAIRIETPEAANVEIAETPEGTATDAMAGMKDAADEFFGKCEEAGLDIEMAPEEVNPLTLDEFEIAGIRHQDLGEWYYDKKFNTIDWRTPEGDEVSLGPAWWKQMIKDLPKILKLLGVEM